MKWFSLDYLQVDKICLCFNSINFRNDTINKCYFYIIPNNKIYI